MSCLCQGVRANNEIENKKEIVLGQESLECVDKFCYLGDMIGAGGGAGDAVRARVRCAWGKFNELKPILTVRGASLRLKGKIYAACVQSVMVYGSDTWPMKVEDMQKLERTESMMMRWMCRVSLKERKPTLVLRKSLGIDDVAAVVRRHRLTWFGHVERKDPKDWVAACRELEVVGAKGKGRPKKTWNDCVIEDMKLAGLRREDAQDRVVWRSGILGKRQTRACVEKKTLKRL